MAGKTTDAAYMHRELGEPCSTGFIGSPGLGHAADQDDREPSKTWRDPQPQKK